MSLPTHEAEQESHADRLDALNAIYDAPVLWRTRKTGNQTVRLMDALEAEHAALEAEMNCPPHLKEGAVLRARTLNAALEALDTVPPHPHAKEHRATIVDALHKLPESTWGYDGPTIIAVPRKALNLLDNLTVPVTKPQGLEIRLWDEGGDDAICCDGQFGHGRETLYLAGGDISKAHINLYRTLRDGLWPIEVCRRVSNII